MWEERCREILGEVRLGVGGGEEDVWKSVWRGVGERLEWDECGGCGRYDGVRV